MEGVGNRMRSFLSPTTVRWMALAVFFAITNTGAWSWQSHSPLSLRRSSAVAVVGEHHRGGSCVALSAVLTDDEKEAIENGEKATNAAAALEEAGSYQQIPTPESPPTKVSSSTATTTSAWEEFGRVLELLGITWSELLSPIGQGLLPPGNQNPSNWDEFWELSLKDTTTTSTRSAGEILVAEQFTRYLERLGATYVKFGQAMASRPDIVPRSLAIALSKLQDDMEVSDESRNLATAEGVRRVMRKEYTKSGMLASGFRNNETELEEFLSSLSETPVAAASIGVVYSGILPQSHEKVAIKIQRPRIKETVQRDAKLLRRVAEILESIPSPRTQGVKISNSNSDSDPQKLQPQADRLIRTNITGAVDEFMTRLEEELDYRREANNLELFGKLYSHTRTSDADELINGLVNLPSDSDIRVVVPRVYKELCTDTILVMEWIDGVKLVDLRQQQQQQQQEKEAETNFLSQTASATTTETPVGETEETMELIQQGIDCTLSQLLETGILHADPHGGNLLKVTDEETILAANNKKKGSKDKSNGTAQSAVTNRLAYIDFGMLSTIPSTVQDGLICAVCQLIFANNVTAVSELFGELQLLPEEILEDPVESAALAEELTLAIGKVLVFPTDRDNMIAEATGKPKIPTLRFDKLLDVLTRLVPRFRFQLPPYFLNNARALATLEGMAREVDPNFNILRSLYPYAISRVFSNPTNSPIVDATLKSLVETPETGRLDIGKILKLLKDASNFSGYSKRKVIKDIAKSKRGPGLVGRLAREQTVGRVVRKLRKRGQRKHAKSRRANNNEQQKMKRRRRWILVVDKLADYSRL